MGKGDCHGLGTGVLVSENTEEAAQWPNRETSGGVLQLAAGVSYWLGHADINTTHIYVEIDRETKRKMIDSAGAPRINKKAPWQEPHVLQWLNKLARGRELCAVNC